MHRLQEVPEGPGVAGSDLVQQPLHAERMAFVGGLAGELREAQQAHRGAGGARAGIGESSRSLRRAINCSPSEGGREEAAALRVGEALDQLRERRAPR